MGDKLERFALGINLAWLDDQYDHDLGRNEVMNRSSAWPQHKANMEAYLKDISLMGAKVVRLWVFERFEGLVFDEQGKVKTIDYSLLDNLADVADTAKKYGLRLYLCLHDTWGVSAHAPEHMQLMNKIVSDEEGRQSFVENALKPLLVDSRLDTSKVFAIDIMHEPEGLYSSVWKADITWQEILNFIKQCTDAIHENSKFRVSCGFQHYQTLMDSKDMLGGLDFYDYHEYNDDGTLMPCNVLGLDKSCIIGGCGQKSNKHDDALQEKVVENFLKNAWEKGYAGCMLWNYGYKGYDKNDTNNSNSLIRSDGRWRKACNAIVKFGRKHEKQML